MYDVDSEKKKVFLRKLFHWHKKNYRNFVWRKSDDPYQIIIAEMMLQKTDAKKVETVFKSFIKKYPSPKYLAKAKIKQIEKDINLLGIHQRAKRMKDLAIDLVSDYNGKIPNEKKQLMNLAGIGEYISNAVLCFAFDKDAPLIDTNFIRIMDRVFSITTTKTRARADKELWETMGTIIPKGLGKEFNFAILDFAALVCKSRNPAHEICPLKDICNYYKKGVLQIYYLF